MGLSRVTSASVSGASFHLHKVYAPRFTRVKGDATVSWKLPALQLYSSLCLSVAHILEHVLDSLYLHFCEDASELTTVILLSWVDLTLCASPGPYFEISFCSALILLIWIW